MALKTRTCRKCKKSFTPRNAVNIYCSRKECKRSRRSGYMSKYMESWKIKHPDYWKSEKQREYLKRWRDNNPDYFVEWRKSKEKKKGK